MGKISWLMASLLSMLLWLAFSHATAFAEDAAAKGTEPWVVLPAGAKQAYMGIHGGTMPVSLLVARDGASLLSFVGCTGNDFLKTVRPHVSSAPSPRKNPGAGTGGTILFAGNATKSLPVVALSGDILSDPTCGLQPFGLSDEPLSIEGEVARPEIFPAQRPRAFSLKDWLFPPRQKGR